MFIKFKQTDHVCSGKLEKGVFTFTCNQCEYVRILDTITNESEVINQGDINATHSGCISYIPDILDNEN